MSSEPEYIYDAFISYRHVEPDRKYAKWLHRALETYKVSKDLVAMGYPAKIKKVFRDEDELPASSDLSSEINRALEKSNYLIVICSPRVVESIWCDAEVKRFRELGRDNKILALLTEGEPSESFLPSLCEIRRHVIKEDGSKIEEIETVEPLAADIRERVGESQRELKSLAKLRILACLLGCKFDDLRKREQKRKHQKLIVSCTFLTALLIILSGLTIWAMESQAEAEKQKEIAQKELNAKLELEEGEKERLAKIAIDANKEYLLGKNALEENQLIDAQTAFRKALFLDPANSGSRKLIIETSLKHMDLAIKEQSWMQANEKLMQAYAYGLTSSEYRAKSADIKRAQKRRQNFLNAEVNRYMNDAQKLKRSIPEVIAKQELIALKDTHTVTALIPYITHQNYWCRNLAMKSLAWMYEKGHLGREELIKKALLLIEPKYKGNDNTSDSQTAALTLLCQWAENDIRVYQAVDNRTFWDKKDGRLLKNRIYFFFTKMAKTVNNLNANNLPNLLMSQTRNKEALVILSDIINSNPSDYGAYVNRAICYHHLKQYKNAIADCDKAISLNNKYVHPFINRANCKYYLGMHKEAIPDLKEALKINPKEQTALVDIAKNYAKLKDYDKSLNFVNNAISFDKKNFLAYLTRADVYNDLGEYKKAIADYTDVITLYPFSIDALMGRGKTYKAVKNFNLALEDLNKIPVINNTYKLYLNERGLLYLEMNRPDLAIQDFTELIKIEPKNAAPVGNVGVYYYNQKDYEKAISYFRKAISLDKNNSTFYSNLGNAYLALKQYELAQQSYFKAIKLNKKNEGIFSSLGKCHLKLKQYDLALDNYNTACNYAPEKAVNFIILADIYNIKGNKTEAKKYYDLGISKTDLPNVEYHNARGDFFFFSYDYNNAIIDYSVTIQLQPENYLYYMKRATSYQSLKNYTLAIKDFDEAIKRNNKYPNLYYNRGLMKYHLKDYDGALKDMDRTLNINKNFISSYHLKAKIQYKLKNYDNAHRDISIVIKNGNKADYTPLITLSKILIAQKKTEAAKSRLQSLLKGMKSLKNKNDIDKANLKIVEELLNSVSR